MSVIYQRGFNRVQHQRSSGIGFFGHLSQYSAPRFRSHHTEVLRWLISEPVMGKALCRLAVHNARHFLQFGGVPRDPV